MNEVPFVLDKLRMKIGLWIRLFGHFASLSFLSLPSLAIQLYFGLSWVSNTNVRNLKAHALKILILKSVSLYGC